MLKRLFSVSAKEKWGYAAVLYPVVLAVFTILCGLSEAALAAAPTLNYLSPAKVSAGHPDFTLHVRGADFAADSLVRWNGNDRPTQWISAAELTTIVPAALLGSAGTVAVTVYTPGAEGGESPAKSFVIDTPHNLALIGHLKPGWEAQKIRVVGNYAYIAAGEDGLRVVDVSDPAQPLEVGFYDTPDQAEDLKVVGNYAYIADGMEHLTVVNIFNPSAPTLAGTFKHTGGYVKALDIAGDYIYLAQEYSGLKIADISDPANITFVAQFDTPAIVQGVVADGNYVYVADYRDFIPDPPIEGGLRVVDVSDPYHPALAAYAPLFTYPYRLIKNQNHLYVADQVKGLSIIDVSDPLNPAESGSLPGSPYDLVINNGRLFSGGFSGINVYALNTPISLTNVGYFKTAGSSRGLAVGNGYIYVADGEEGLKIFQIKNSLYLPLLFKL